MRCVFALSKSKGTFRPIELLFEQIVWECMGMFNALVIGNVSASIAVQCIFSLSVYSDQFLMLFDNC